jgi:hypothetical protein
MRKVKHYIGNILIKVLIYLIKNLGKMKYSEKQCEPITQILEKNIFSTFDIGYLFDVITIKDNDIDHITYDVNFKDGSKINFTLSFKIKLPEIVLQPFELKNYLKNFVELNLTSNENTIKDMFIQNSIVTKICGEVKNNEYFLKFHFIKMFNENVQRILE